MTTIKQLLAMPIGQGTGGYTLPIKTRKKKWQVEEIWWQQVILMDKTGEIPADVKIGTYKPLDGKIEIRIIVAEIQNAEYLGKDRKKLVVDQYSIPSMTMDEYYTQEEDWHCQHEEEIKGKIRHGIICAMISRNPKDGNITLIPDERCKQDINELVNFIMTGE